MTFESDATDLVAGFSDANGPGKADIFVRDMQAKVTSLVSRATLSATTGGNGPSNNATIAGGGRYVIFDSRATNLELPSIYEGTAVYHLLERDLQTGVTQVVDATPDNAGVGNQGAGAASITPDGRYVADGDGPQPVNGFFQMHTATGDVPNPLWQ